MPKDITVFRSGSAVWLEVDGQALPVDWIEEVQVNVAAGDEEDTVSVLMRADRVHLESHPVPAPAYDEAFPEEADDGEAQEGSAKEAPTERVRVPGDEEVPDPRPFPRT